MPGDKCVKINKKHICFLINYDLWSQSCIANKTTWTRDHTATKVA